jgi:YfiH family protein
VIAEQIGRAFICFTDRHGGVSHGVYASANLGDHVGDSPDDVRRNREQLARATVGVPLSEWTWLRQVHGDDVAVVDDEFVATAERGDAMVATADASVTELTQRPLAICTADCAPIAIVAGEGEAVAAVHAGWQGLKRGVVERAVAQLRKLSAAPLTAVLGPCIHPDHYAFGVDDLAVLEAAFDAPVVSKTIDGEPAFDLPTAVRIVCERSDIATFTDVGVCTYASNDHFSYRRDGITGRQALVAMLQ